jgi:hypothetical protein
MSINETGSWKANCNSFKSIGRILLTIEKAKRADGRKPHEWLKITH